MTTSLALNAAVDDLVQAMHVLLGAHHGTHDSSDGDMDAWLERGTNCNWHACAQARKAIAAYDAARTTPAQDTPTTGPRISTATTRRGRR